MARRKSNPPDGPNTVSFFADPEDGRYFLGFCYAKQRPVLEGACRDLLAAFEQQIPA